MKLKKILVALWAATSVHAAQAETQVESDSQTLLAPVTVSASPIHEHESFEVPSQVDSLAGQEKMARDSGSLGEMLESVPGVNNMSAGAQSGKPVIRGMTGNRVKVLSNGQSTDYQAYGTRHNPNVEPYLAERVEVIRGPQSVLYGSEAMGGVVNVLQSEIPYDEPISGQLAGEYNSNNRETMVGAKMGAGSEKFGVTAGFAVREADNFRVPDVSSSQGATPSSPVSDKPLFVGEMPNTNFENRAANIGLGYQDDWGKVELRHTQWISKQNYLGVEAEDKDSPYEAVAAGQKLQNDETQLSAEFFLNDDWILKPSWTHTRNQREATHDLPFETMAEDKGTEHYLDLVVHRDDVKLALEHPAIGDFNGEIGMELTEKQQTLRSGHLSPSADVSKRAVYLFEEADYDKWLVQFGARYDTHSVKAPLSAENEHFYNEMGVFDATNNERDFDVFTGSVGATYRLDGNWSLAGNVARGFRAPSIFELYAGGEHGGVQAFQLGNPDLDAETSLNTDLSLRWQTDKAQMTATVYQNWVNNYIYLANTGYYRASEGSPNEGERVDADAPGAIVEMQSQQTDAEIRGFEFSYAQQFNARWSGDVALEIIEGRDVKNHQGLPLIPANNLALNGHYHPADRGAWKNQRVSLGVKLVADKNAAGTYEPFSQFDNLPIGTASTDAYAVWNLGYVADVKLDKRTVQLGAAVENLFDTAYVDFLNTYKGYTLNTGRNFKLSARLNF
ncbi:TonB-dependent receptor [Thiomicrorhabdus sp. ZW0627]|uniref:TonB-dependent receptor n=1 Tax=Thiomicrorhabdus sp. ZW0627 TaxID=3039774 RepID=UPI002436A9E4|nr:TonB-dependent receptor [Thiomicrorhabdus sp. ZW0627]MDG6774377.1 TonB-dependent receptor [Thiomicrorhabdus sp. ZW0627]